MTESKCQGCGRRIVWGIREGRHIPLDPSAPVYRLESGRAAKAENTYVSHFATCSHANDFSASRKREPAPVPERRRLYVRPYRDQDVTALWKNEVSNRPVKSWNVFVDTGETVKEEMPR